MKQEKNQSANSDRRPSTVSNRSASASRGSGGEKPKGTASPVQFPTLSLPKGGGAIQGIGEKFQANPVTGTGSMSVPIAISPGRSGFAPQLALSYDSGAGNGAFGLGWDVGLPSISRKTQKGLPQYDGLPKYQDGAAIDSDVFLLSGAEDLVPVLKADGSRQILTHATGFQVFPYRPRIEGLFAKIEKWVATASGDTHWRATTKDNLTSIYGLNADSRIADSGNPNKVFSWLLERTFDNKGNVLIYEYKREDLAGVAPAIFEKNRKPDNATAQQYLKRVKYGNTVMYSSPMNTPVAAIPTTNEWLFELVFDYGEHDTVSDVPQYAATKTWVTRLDPFSSYRAGFEIRDYRLCRRILMFHCFTELGADPYLVKSTLLEYDENPIATQLKSIQHAGYLTENGVTTTKTFPPVGFKYTEQKIDNTLYSLTAADLPNAPEGIDGSRYRWSDLEGEGLSGILSQMEGAWYYKRNLGDGTFGAKELVRNRPSLAGAGVADYEGNGLNDYVLQNGSLNGFFEMDDLGEWQPFRAFTDIPNIDWNDPNLRTLDLDGDGIADLLLTENDCFVWYASKGKDGFDPARRVSKALDEEQGPRIVFQEAFQTIFLADLSGSGMTDIARIRNGEVCYWPNLGYGRFGAKVTMAGAPQFDRPGAFDPSRIRLADIDGSGTTDIVYLDARELAYWINQSGNRWSERKTVPGFPTMTPLHSVQVFDLLGNGTSCIVWSSPLPGEANTPLRYIQLMGKTETEGNKPYLLKEVNNNMGAVTRLKYESSTRFYLDDRKAGKPWITKLPFTVQVLTRQEVYDAISDTYFVSKYAYHHGYFDPVEREFRGFGMVEQWDTEDYDSFKEQALFQAKAYNWSEESHIPPIHTKTWFHNGYYRQGGKITRQYESEYYGARDAGGNLTEWTLADTPLPAGLQGDVAREAARALKGRPLRVEMYADDAITNPGLAPHPYTVTESNYQIKVIQPKGENRHTVFFAAENETLAFQYERNPDDPRVAHSFALSIDEFGNPTRRLAVVYPCRTTTPHPEQQRLYCTYTEADFINKPAAVDFYRTGVPYQQKLYEITGLAFLNKQFSKTELENALAASQPIEFETTPDFSNIEKRPVQWAKTTFYNSDLSGELPEGEIAHHGLPFKACEAAYTDAQLQAWYGALLPANAMQDGGFEQEAGYWWRPSGCVVFDAARFYLPIKQIDLFGQVAEVEYDGYALLPKRSFTAIHGVMLETAAEYDYRTLQPRLLTDPNGNHSAALFDEMGMVVATAIYGKTDAEGDSLDGYVRQPVSENTDERVTIYTDPRTYLQNATSFFYYDLHAWRRTGAPNCALGIMREIHASDENGMPSPLQFSFAYSDGFGRAITVKVQAEPGDAMALDNQGNVITVQANPRWIGNGRTVFNNKGKPVKQYEPYFSNTWEYESEKALVEYGVTPVLHYDPAGRVVRTDMPDGTFSKVTFTPWEQLTYDANDTVLESDWYLRRTDSARPDFINDIKEKQAAAKAAAHADTPGKAYIDTLGRVFLTEENNGAEGIYLTRVELDIEGNQRSVTDALGRKVMQSVFNIAGETVQTLSMDAGRRWMFTNALGNPLYTWDERGHTFQYTYDALQRPVQTKVLGGDGNTPLDHVFERVEYGESQPDARAKNLLGQVLRHYDTGGLLETPAYDFKGQPLSSIRRLFKKYKETANWTGSNLHDDLEPETYTFVTETDALGRISRQTAPDGSVITPAYDRAGLLCGESVAHAAPALTAAYIKNIRYDEKGQRERIVYGNDVLTRFYYDPLTFRLRRLESKRANGDPLQDWHYTYDPTGNITHIEDKNAPTVFFDNQKITALAEYTYDALYRLIQATGREGGVAAAGNAADNWNDAPFLHALKPNDPMALWNYTQAYQYDAVGNILQMKHQSDHNNWTRAYQYQSANNRLQSTQIGSNTYTYPHHAQHGYMTALPHLEDIGWNFKEEIVKTVRQRRSDGGTPEATYYQYDAQGQRIRKITENSANPGATPTRKDERIYIAGYEVYKKHSGPEAGLERISISLLEEGHRFVMVDLLRHGADGSAPYLVRYQQHNHLGSAALELDAAARVISYEEYHPYGTTAYQASNTTILSASKRYRYTGMERDEETGLEYHAARYYLPWLGRWCSADPIGIGDGVNVYGYGKGNSIISKDSKGTQVENETGFTQPAYSNIIQNHPKGHIDLSFYSSKQSINNNNKSAVSAPFNSNKKPTAQNKKSGSGKQQNDTDQKILDEINKFLKNAHKLVGATLTQELKTIELPSFQSNYGDYYGGRIVFDIQYPRQNPVNRNYKFDNQGAYKGFEFNLNMDPFRNTIDINNIGSTSMSYRVGNTRIGYKLSNDFMSTLSFNYRDPNKGIGVTLELISRPGGVTALSGGIIALLIAQPELIPLVAEELAVLVEEALAVLTTTSEPVILTSPVITKYSY